MSEALLDALLARRGLICAVGAGGKKTTLGRLFKAHPGRVALTATCHTMPFPDDLDATVVTGPQGAVEAAVLGAAERTGRLAFAGPPVKKGRLSPLDPQLVARLHAEGDFDATLVKADGARTRSIKAPGDGEPNLPADTDTVIFVVSAAALGRPLDDRIAHRPERLATVTGAVAGEPLECRHLAALLSSPQAAGKNLGNARLVGLVNQVDDAERRTQAVQIAEQALAAGGPLDRVVLTCMRSADPVLEVFHRAPV